MDEEEAEQAAAPAALSINGDAQEAAKDDSVSGNTPPAMDNAGVGKRQETVPGNPDCVAADNLAEESVREQRDACSVSQVPKAADKESAVIAIAAEEMDAEAAPAKRRHEDVVAASQDQRLRLIEASVGVSGAKKKARGAVRMRASSLSRGDRDANP
ncbi:hypothetical protein MTO96_031755 [Rhipicephalus appendiculatus]